MLFFALFLLIGFPIYWFVFIFPVKEFNKLYAEVPLIVNNLVIENYPKDLAIYIKSGKIEINKPTPYCLVVDKKQNKGIIFDENANPATLLNAETPIYDSLCKPVALVGKNFVVYTDFEANSYGSYKIQEIFSAVNYQFTWEKVEQVGKWFFASCIKLG